MGFCLVLESGVRSQDSRGTVSMGAHKECAIQESWEASERLLYVGVLCPCLVAITTTMG